MTKLLRRSALLAGILVLGACASTPPAAVNYAAPPARHADAKTTLENHY